MKEEYTKFTCELNHQYGDATKEWVMTCPECGGQTSGVVERKYMKVEDTKNWRGIIGK